MNRLQSYPVVNFGIGSEFLIKHLVASLNSVSFCCLKCGDKSRRHFPGMHDEVK